MMIGKSSLKSILLYDLNDIQERIFNLLKQEALAIFPAIILIAALMTFLFGLDFAGVIKRSFLAIAAIFIFQWFFTGAADIGFQVADSFISKENKVLAEWHSALLVAKDGFRKIDQAKDIKTKGKHLINMIGDQIFSALIWMLSNLALWFVSISFTLAYYMPMIMIPVVALVNIFPLTAKSLEGSIVSAIWVLVTPIVIAVILELINGILINQNILSSASVISKLMMGILFALYLVSSFGLAFKMIGRSGIGEGVAQIGQSFGTGMVMAATNFALSKSSRIGKSLIIGSPGKQSALTRMALNPVQNMRSRAYQASQKVRSLNPAKAQEIHSGKKTQRSKSEQISLVKNVVLNPGKAIRDRHDRNKVAKNAVNSNNLNKVIDQNATNHYRAESGKQLISKNGKAYTPKDNHPITKDATFKSAKSLDKLKIEQDKSNHSSKIQNLPPQQKIINNHQKLAHRKRSLSSLKKKRKVMPRVNQPPKEENHEL